MYQDRNNSKKLIKPFVALANTPLKDLKWVGLSEEDKIRLRKLYPKPWMDQEFRWSCPLTTIPDVPIGKLNGAVIPEECEVDFYTELYGDEARCYFDVLSKAEKSEKIFADASEQANAMIPVQNQMQGPAPISAWESGMVSGGRQNAFAANQFQAPVPVFTPMEGRVFSEKDCNDADTADNICRILDGSYIYVAEQNAIINGISAFGRRCRFWSLKRGLWQFCRSGLYTFVPKKPMWIWTMQESCVITKD